MKLSIALLATLCVQHHQVGAFVNVVIQRSVISTSTSLNQFGTFGFDTTSLYTREEEAAIKKQNEIMAYLADSQLPNTILRSNLGTSVMISGFNPEDPSSAEILAFLNNEDSPHFPFTKIVAHVEDMKLAKKRLIGRNTRYTGLNDKLEFSEGASLPTVDQLADVSSWVVHVGGGDMSILGDIADVAEKADSVKNVAILVSGATSSVSGDALKEAEELLKTKATTFAYTLLVVPEWNDEPESSCAFGIANATDVVDSAFVEGETFSREESLRIITECLAIDKAAGKCVVANAAKDTTSLDHMLIQGMREIGFNRIAEIEHMVTMGAKGYNDLMEVEVDAGWEKVPEETEEEKAAKAATKEEKLSLARESRDEAAKQEELADMATQWAKREYLRRSLKKPINIKEDEFIEIIWDRAMFEADLKYRTMQGQAVNESEERTQFKEDQEQKKADAYKAEQERWKQMDKQDIDPPEEAKTVSLRL